MTTATSHELTWELSVETEAGLPRGVCLSSTDMIVLSFKYHHDCFALRVPPRPLWPPCITTISKPFQFWTLLGFWTHVVLLLLEFLCVHTDLHICESSYGLSSVRLSLCLFIFRVFGSKGYFSGFLTSRWSLWWSLLTGSQWLHEAFIWASRWKNLNYPGNFVLCATYK